MTLTLIGMPGAGKSCMGKAIAGKLKLKNLDTDRLIERNDGRRLQTIINEDGVDAFKKLEESTLLSINDDGLLISTGGSAVYYEKAMLHLKTLGPVVYLYTSYETTKKRLGDFSARGVVLAPGQTLKDLYDEREALYKKYADITINCDGNAFQRYQAELLEALKKYN
jgi:shikimate kinase